MSPSYLLSVFFVLCSIAAVFGDIYLQHPPGNNNRFQEQGDRQTATRLFNSQNNARGGYCWGATMTYYEGSVLAVEWTNQHSCGIDNNRCEVIIQYMCGSDAEGDDETLFIRDGNANNQERIPTGTTPGQDDYYNRKNAGGELRYGMNEPLSNYLTCIQRQRNKGLWISTETPGDGNGAMATRQNAGGTRYGFECTEERDHYPYWHPSVWKDVVVFTTDKDRCDYYKSESQNVKDKNYCANITDTGNGKTPNNEQECARNGGQWKVQKSWGMGKPECKQAPHNRDNHLGNGDGVHTNSYNWTLPRSGQEDCIKNGNCTCILRIRYNITVGEVPFDLDWRANGKRSPVKDNQDLPYMGANYTFTINDNQAARTFQDRSYMFRIAPRPSGVPTSAKIYNLNVRGKRGNIVQTYPATEYDFVPTFLTVTQGDYIHFQWTGCDNNPANQDGQGRDRTDRSNIVQMKDMSRNFPLNETEMKTHRPLLFKNADLRARMANIDQPPQNCLSREDLERVQAETGLDEEENPQNCFLLNAAGPRFSGAIVKMEDIGFYAYMSTRNNNFSNRSQKGSITVESAWKPWKTAVVVVSGIVAISVGAAAGTIFYAKRHPLSRVAEVVHKVPGFSKI